MLEMTYLITLQQYTHISKYCINKDCVHRPVLKCYCTFIIDNLQICAWNPTRIANWSLETSNKQIVTKANELFPVVVVVVVIVVVVLFDLISFTNKTPSFLPFLVSSFHVPHAHNTYHMYVTCVTRTWWKCDSMCLCHVFTMCCVY